MSMDDLIAGAREDAPLFARSVAALATTHLRSKRSSTSAYR
jgi:hypothetical protein